MAKRPWERDPLKKSSWKIYASIAVVVVVIVVVLLMMRKGEVVIYPTSTPGEDNEKVNPSAVSGNVEEKQDAIACALHLYKIQKPTNGYDSQCLGVCGKYAADIVHNPRSADDDMRQNQCLAYLDNQVLKFIEFDQEGNILRIVE